jgi:hypothetical protein
MYICKNILFMANISKTLEQDLKEQNMSFILRDTMDYNNENVSESKADEITIYDYNDYIDFKSFKLPKNKIVDLEWIMNKMNTDKVYQSFTENFKTLLKEAGYTNGITVYPTSYGIGVFVAFGRRESILEIKNNIENILNNKEIEYKIGSSDAGWVLRFYISKKKENINKLK